MRILAKNTIIVRFLKDCSNLMRRMNHEVDNIASLLNGIACICPTPEHSSKFTYQLKIGSAHE